VWTQIACLALTLENADGQQCVLPSLSGLARIDFSLPLYARLPPVCPALDLCGRASGRKGELLTTPHASLPVLRCRDA
jgi:hypothetical protein